MLKALVGSLDAHSAFLTEDEREEREESWGPGKRLYGVMMRGRGLTPWGMLLDAPTPGSSAALNGLAAGQVLLSVAGTSTVGLAMAEVSALYLPTEATVRLEVGTLRNRRVVSRRVVTLRRGAVVDEPHRVTTKLDRVDGVRVLTVTFASFFSGLAGQVERALTHAKADVVVLDLRGNGGGLVDEALRVADLFCADDVFLLTRGPQGLRRWTSPGLPQAWSGPVVVAVGEGTASASELLAGTLQAKGRALLVGGPHTWGKGTMQEPLHARLDLSWGELVVTTAQTFLLDGRSPQCAGLALDLPLGPAPAQPHNECDAAGSLAAAEVDSLLSEEDQARRVDVMFYDAMLADAGSVLNVAAGLVRAQRELQDPVSTR
jgi:carboxyl-terminal processing protease